MATERCLFRCPNHGSVEGRREEGQTIHCAHCHAELEATVLKPTTQVVGVVNPMLTEFLLEEENRPEQQ